MSTSISGNYPVGITSIIALLIGDNTNQLFLVDRFTQSECSSLINISLDPSTRDNLRLYIKEQPLEKSSIIEVDSLLDVIAASDRQLEA